MSLRDEGLTRVCIRTFHPHSSPLPEGEGTCRLIFMLICVLLPTHVRGWKERVAQSQTSRLLVLQEAAQLRHDSVDSLGVRSVGNEFEIVDQIIERLGAVSQLVVDHPPVPVIGR